MRVFRGRIKEGIADPKIKLGKGAVGEEIGWDR
jgi:hypothetical protein